jgi:hypothetical protein
MGILAMGLLLGFVLASWILSIFVAWLITKLGFISPGKVKALASNLTFVVVASPFLYWSISIYIVGWLWAAECEERTRYIFHSSPPLDFVSIQHSPPSSSSRIWKYLADTDIRSIVVTDKWGRGLTGEDGSFVLRLAEANDPGCESFYAYVARKKSKTPYLGDRCITIEPLDSAVEVFRQSQQGDYHVLRKWGPLEVRETRTLLQEVGRKKVYAEYVQVYFSHPKPPYNWFAAFAIKPSCKKSDALKISHWNDSSKLFEFAFSARGRAEIENIFSRL